MRRDSPLTATDLKCFLVTPPTFRELAEKYSLTIEFEQTPLLQKLQELLGWGLQHLGSENVFLLLAAATEDPGMELSELQSIKVKQMRTASSAREWDERDVEKFSFEPSFIATLRLLRLASALSGQLVTSEMERLASEGQELPRLICFIGRGNELTIVDSNLTIEVSDLGQVNRLYKEPCQAFLAKLCEGIPSIDNVIVKHTLPVSEPVPGWMEGGPIRPPGPRLDNAGDPSSDSQKSLERRAAQRLSNMRSLSEVESPKSKEMALLDLESLAQECRREGLNLLFGSINETRVLEATLQGRAAA